MRLIYALPLAAIAAMFVTANEVFYQAALGLGALCVVVAMVVITGHTLLRVRDPVVRAQTAWVALGLVFGLAFWPLLWLLVLLFPGLSPALDRLPWWLALPLQVVPSLAFPVCLGIAITRYRLFDIAPSSEYAGQDEPTHCSGIDCAANGIYSDGESGRQCECRM
jgi:hypothetical protein